MAARTPSKARIPSTQSRFVGTARFLPALSDIIPDQSLSSCTATTTVLCDYGGCRGLGSLECRLHLMGVVPGQVLLRLGLQSLVSPGDIVDRFRIRSFPGRARASNAFMRGGYGAGIRQLQLFPGLEPTDRTRAASMVGCASAV